MNPFAIASLFTSLLAWIAMRIVLKIPALRHTMWPVWVLQVGSAGCAIAALLDPVSGIVSGSGICALVGLVLFVGFLLVYVMALRLPARAGRPEVGRQLLEFQVTTEDGARISPRELAGGGPMMLVFFRGFWCLSCTDELMGLTQVRDALRKKGGVIIAISADRMQVLLVGRKRLPDLPCIVACDPGAEAISALHLLHESMAKMGKRISVPANVLVDKDGVVRWTHFAGIVMDRPDPRAVLAQVAKL